MALCWALASQKRTETLGVVNMSQNKIEDNVIINAPLNKVWEAIKDPTKHAAWHPFITHISGEHELGSVRQCDIDIRNKPGHTKERCTLYEEGREIVWRIEKDSSGFSRMVSDWMAGFSLEPKDSNATVVMARSTFRPKSFFVRLMMPFIRRKFHQTQKIILNGLKEFIER